MTYVATTTASGRAHIAVLDPTGVPVTGGQAGYATFSPMHMKPLHALIMLMSITGQKTDARTPKFHISTG